MCPGTRCEYQWEPATHSQRSNGSRGSQVRCRERRRSPPDRERRPVFSILNLLERMTREPEWLSARSEWEVSKILVLSGHQESHQSTSHRPHGLGPSPRKPNLNRSTCLANSAATHRLVSMS